MLPKIIIGVVLLSLGIMAFGFFIRGGFGPPPADSKSGSKSAYCKI